VHVLLKTALQVAVERKRVGACKILLAARADPNKPVCEHDCVVGIHHSVQSSANPPVSGNIAIIVSLIDGYSLYVYDLHNEHVDDTQLGPDYLLAHTMRIPGGTSYQSSWPQ